MCQNAKMCLEPTFGGGGEARAEGTALALGVAGGVGSEMGAVPEISGYCMASACFEFLSEARAAVDVFTFYTLCSLKSSRAGESRPCSTEPA